MANPVGQLLFYVKSAFDPKGFNKLDKRTKKTTKNVKTMSNSIKSSMLDTKNLIAGITAGIGTGFALKGLTDVTMELDRVKTRFETVGGSVERGAELMAKSSEIARQYGLDLASTRKGLTGVLGSMKGMNYTQEQGIDLFINLSKAVAGLRMSTADAKGALTAFGQIISKGKIQAEELRRQLANRLPGAFPIAAKSLGMTSAELDQALRDGAVSADALFKIAQGLAKEFGKNAEKSASGVVGSINRMKTAFTELLEIVAEKGFGKSLTLLAQQMEKFLVSEDAKKFAAQMGQLSKVLVASLPDIAASLKEILGVIKAMIPILKFVAGLFIIKKFMGFIGFLRKSAVAIFNLFGKISKYFKFFGRLMSRFGFKKAVIGLLLKRFTVGLINPIIGLIWMIWDVIKTIIDLASGKALKDVDTISSGVITLIKFLAKKLWELIPSIWSILFGKGDMPDFDDIKTNSKRMAGITAISGEKFRQIKQFTNSSMMSQQNNEFNIEVYSEDTQEVVNAITNRVPMRMPKPSSAFGAG